MPYRRLPNSMSAVLHTLKTARDTWKNTAAAERALTAEHWAKLDDAAPASFLNRLLKEADDVDLALAAQAPLTSALSQSAARLTMFISHFHQVLDLGITRGTFAAGARSYYGRDIAATTIPDLSTYAAVAEAAQKIVDGEAARATAEAANPPLHYDSGATYDSGIHYDSGHVPMAMPGAAEVGARRGEFTTLFDQQTQAVVKTDREREEAQALYAEAQALAVDIIESVEFYYRKDADAASRRAKCARWGVVYVYEDGTAEPPPAAPGA
ncbi:MAG: hypothetical protein HZA89_05455 [Verrucomicrobia bacterium]|nr:hypothetical protein [Verrucomicrobiota bacterium]